jgi:DNA invertase Pin-like site-specific DNA recombinase
MSYNATRTLNKVTPEHLERLAYIYIRQSTLFQVRQNTASTERQYDLTKRAYELGWSNEHIVVIDEDQGHSGASSADRSGFQRLVLEVSLGRVGAVIGLEVSRLARSSSDWPSLSNWITLNALSFANPSMVVLSMPLVAAPLLE